VGTTQHGVIVSNAVASHAARQTDIFVVSLQPWAARANILAGLSLGPLIARARINVAVHTVVVQFAWEAPGVVGVVVESVDTAAVGGLVGARDRAHALVAAVIKRVVEAVVVGGTHCAREVVGAGHGIAGSLCHFVKAHQTDAVLDDAIFHT
jgi:hypothetical protein